MAISGITISPEGKDDFIFSLPYMLSKGQFLTLRQSHIHSLDDLTGMTIGIIKDEMSGGVLYTYIDEHYPQQFKIKQYTVLENMFSDLSNKTIAAVFLYRSDVNYWNHNGSNLFKTIGPVVTLGEGMGIAALPKNADLIAQINTVLQQMEQDNSYSP